MLRDLLREAYGAMQYNRRRTALTMLGMAWGIATVVLLLAYGNGFGRACANIFANFGTKLMIMVPGRTSMQAGGQKAGAPIRFTLYDVDVLTTNIPQIARITPEASKQANIQYETSDVQLQRYWQLSQRHFHPRAQTGGGPLLQPRRRDATRTRRSDRLRGQRKALLRA